MKSIVKQSDKKAAFTIVELLTVMSIIVILIGLLVPALNKVRIFAREVKQKAQFHSIGVALEQFNSQFDRYPESSALGADGNPYCGAMKLAEALVGQDLLGYNPDSVFNSNGMAGTVQLYNVANPDISARKGPYLPIENANAYLIGDIYENYAAKNFSATSRVLCDVFNQTKNKTTGENMGLPILYYKAHPSKILFTVSDPANSIYNYLDNQDLLMLGKPGNPTFEHRLATESTPGYRFYRNTQNIQVTQPVRPYNSDTYILISAGNDGEYGTSDDICNFEFKYRPEG